MSDAQTWYRVDKYSAAKVAPVQVVRATDKTVVVLEKMLYGNVFTERRVNRRSEWHVFYPTEIEAWTQLRDRAVRKVELHKQELQRARTALGEADAALRRLSNGEQP